MNYSLADDQDVSPFTMTLRNALRMVECVSVQQLHGSPREVVTDAQPPRGQVGTLGINLGHVVYAAISPPYLLDQRRNP